MNIEQIVWKFWFPYSKKIGQKSEKLKESYFFSPLQQFGIFAWNQGIKRALKITRDFPALLLMPVFSNWAFGPLEKKSLVDCKGNPKLGVSFTSTVINTIITLIGLISCQIWIYSSGTVMKNFFDSKSNFRNDVRFHHMFARILNFLFSLRKKCLFDKK